MRKTIAVVILFLLALSASLGTVHGTAFAQGGDKAKFEGLLNKLLAPGPLILGHDNLEHKDCLKCHEAGGGVPNKNCLSCHKDIAKDIDARMHFHGLMNNKNCIDCHKEHKGRNNNINFFDKNNFDHELTGFKLDGAHAKTECTKCHTETRSDKPTRKSETQFHGKVNSCIACHKKDDIHFFESNKFKGKECSSCHVTEAWKNVQKFDHTKETGYALVGDHAQLKCVKCHVFEGKNNIKYNWPQLPARKCLACHKDQHAGNFSPKFQGGDCVRCHTQTEWRIPAFKHDITGFILQGKHAQIQCVDCHKRGNQGKALPNFNFKGVQRTCVSCHKDYHGYGKEIAEKLNAPLSNCQNCHSEVAWKSNLRFDHDTQTRFPITGKHRKNACFDCHKPLGGARFKSRPNTLRAYFFKTIPAKTCETCHRSPHPKAFHKQFKGIVCAQCHTTDGWDIQSMQGQITSNPTFHSKTRFPLTGSHVKLACKSCHQVKGQEVYKFPSPTKNFCVDCHATPHKRQFSESTQEKPCSTCHTTIKFESRLPFDHDTTSFKLVGKHRTVNSCWKCHLPTKQTLPTLKVAKTAHLFKFSRANDANLCSNCHVSVHKKQFKEEYLKRSCASCHTPQQGFDRINDFDHNQTDFKLTGSHEKLAAKCVECHKPSKDIILATKPPKNGKQFIFPGQQKGYCENCHVNEHKNMFDAKFAQKPCLSCHTTQAFSPRKAFDHDQTDFEIKGKHKQVKCAECHTPTKERFTQGKRDFKGRYNFPELPKKDCATCHKDPHNGGNGPQCSKCHTEAGWKSAGDFHKDMELVGVHLLTDCKACHSTGRTLRGSSQECSVCHIKEDNHNGQLPVCGDCHLQNFWNQTKFDHNMTRFPLQGAHRVTECRACHNQGVYQGLPIDCRSCHFRDAEGVPAPDHKSPRYFQCERCHSTFSFPGALSN